MDSLYEKKKRKCDDALASHLLTHQIDYLPQDHSLVQERLIVKELGGEKGVIYRPFRYCILLAYIHSIMEAYSAKHCEYVVKFSY